MELKRWHYLTLSVLVAGAIVALLVASEQRAALVGDLVAENDYLTRRLEQSREQLLQMTERQIELEAAIHNRTHSPARGGRLDGWETMPVTTPSGLSAATLERALADTELAGLGGALVAAETATGVSALVLAAICAHESGWGSSRLARDKCNLAGLGAYPGEEYSAGITFASRASCVLYLGRLLRDKPGDHLAEIGVWYATDPQWAAKVAACVETIAERSGTA